MKILSTVFFCFGGLLFFIALAGFGGAAPGSSVSHRIGYFVGLFLPMVVFLLLGLAAQKKVSKAAELEQESDREME